MQRFQCAYGPVHRGRQPVCEARISTREDDQAKSRSTVMHLPRRFPMNRSGTGTAQSETEVWTRSTPLVGSANDAQRFCSASELNCCQRPSEMMFTVPSTTEIAVWSSIA